MQIRPTLALAALALAACTGSSDAQSHTRAAATPASPTGSTAATTSAAAATTAGTTGVSDTVRSIPLALRAKGSATAPVTVYEMSDFQCPFCRRYAIETFPAIEREYISTGKVRWIFINFPLTQLHANAAPAAELALCAARAGKFWPVHDLLYKYQETWAPLKDPGAFFVSLADSVAMPRADLVACLRNPSARAVVEADAGGAAQSGASSTPSFYIEGGMMSGALPASVFRHVLDSIYAVKTRK